MLHLICAHFVDGDRTAALHELHCFTIATNTPFTDNSRVFRLLTMSVTGSEPVLTPSVEVFLKVLRVSASEQYPGQIPVLYPAELATASEYFMVFWRNMFGVWWTFDKQDSRHQRQNTYSPSISRGSFIALACKQTHTRPIGRAVALQRLIRITSNSIAVNGRTYTTVIHSIPSVVQGQMACQLARLRRDISSLRIFCSA